MSRSPSMSEHNGLNGGKASDWLRLYAPKEAVSNFGGGVRLTYSSNGRGLFEPYGSLFCPYWRESEAQLAKKQVVLLMHDIYFKNTDLILKIFKEIQGSISTYSLNNRIIQLP